MVSLSSARFTIGVNGQEKVLVSLGESKKGDLFVVLRTRNRFVARTGSQEPPIGSRVIEQRFSVHPSDRSPTINVIKYTMKVEVNGILRVGTAHHHTEAIKAGDRFAILFTHRPPSLLDSPFGVDSPKKFDLSVGSYDPTIHSLFFAVLVAKVGLEFDVPEYLETFARYYLDVGNYRVFLLHAAFPPGRRADLLSAEMTYTYTLPPDMPVPNTIRTISERTMQGFNAGQAALLLASQFNAMAKRIKSAAFMPVLIPTEKIDEFRGFAK